MPVRQFLDHAEQRHGRDGHDQNDPVQDQVPQRQYAFEVGRGFVRTL